MAKEMTGHNFTHHESGLLVPKERTVHLPSEAEIDGYGTAPNYLSQQNDGELIKDQIQRELDEKAYKSILDPANVLELKQDIEHAHGRLGTKSVNVNNGLNLAFEKNKIRKELIEQYLHTGDKDGLRTITNEVRHKLDELLTLSYSKLERMAEAQENKKSDNADSDEPLGQEQPSTDEGAKSSEAPTQEHSNAARVIGPDGDEMGAFVIPPSINLEDQTQHDAPTPVAVTPDRSAVTNRPNAANARGNFLRRSGRRVLGGLALLAAASTLAWGGSKLFGDHGSDKLNTITPVELTLPELKGPDTTKSRETSAQQFDFHFFDKNKESEHAFGARGDSNSVEAAVTDMQNRYIGEDGKSDPALIAAHAKELGLYDGLSVNELANKLQDNKDSLAHAVEMLKDIYKTGDWKLVDSPSDYGSLYMTLGKDGKPNIYFDRNVEHTNPGKALQLMVDGKVVAIFRTDCGFQPVMLHSPSYLPTPETPDTPEKTTDMGGGIVTTEKPKTHLESKDPTKDTNRNPKLNPDAGTNGHIAGPGEEKPATDPPQTYTPPAQPTPAPTVERPATSIPPVETGANGANGVNNGSAEQQPDANGV